MQILTRLKGKSMKGILAMMALAVVMSFAVPGAALAAPIDFSTTDGVNVTVTDVVGTGFSFMNMFDQWTLLILGIIFAPVAIGFLIWLFRKLPRYGK